MNNEGPIILRKIIISCKYLNSKEWSIEDGNDYDWGFDYKCLHPDLKTSSYIEQQPETPKWCPFISNICSDCNGVGGSCSSMASPEIECKYCGGDGRILKKEYEGYND